MPRNSKSSAKAERADHRLPRDERADRDASEGLLSPEDLDRGPDSRLTAGDLKRAAAKAKGGMGASTKHDPSLKIAHAREIGTSSLGVAVAGEGLGNGSANTGDTDAVPTRTTRSNAQIAEGVTSTARKSPAPRAARADAADGSGLRGRDINKRTGVRSTSSTGGPHPPKRSGRAGTARGGSRAKGADGNTIE